MKASTLVCISLLVFGFQAKADDLQEDIQNAMDWKGSPSFQLAADPDSVAVGPQMLDTSDEGVPLADLEDCALPSYTDSSAVLHYNICNEELGRSDAAVPFLATK